VALVERVLAGREAGLSLPAAIARAQTPPEPSTISLFATLRQLRPELQPRWVRKPVLLALSRAIEDETMARADALLMFGSFQREVFYRQSQERWRELCGSALAAAVFADFELPYRPESGPAEIPISPRQQIAREWALVIHGGSSSICLVARELAASNVDSPSSARRFELVWSVEPDAVAALARACLALTVPHMAELAELVDLALAIDITAGSSEQVRLMTAVLNRTLSELSDPVVPTIRMKGR